MNMLWVAPKITKPIPWPLLNCVAYSISRNTREVFDR